MYVNNNKNKRLFVLEEEEEETKIIRFVFLFSRVVREDEKIVRVEISTLVFC